VLGVVDVHLVNNDGFGRSDLVVPGITLVGALVGVLVGGYFNRTTLSTLEAHRGEREAELDRERAVRDWKTERRRAYGAAKLLHHELSRGAL
jgi:hypothetical protein